MREFQLASDGIQPQTPLDTPPPSPLSRMEKGLMPPVRQGTNPTDTAAELARLIHTQYYQALQDRVEWENRLAEWEDQYYGRRPEKTFPWPGCSNFHVPITMMGVETYKPRLIEAILGQEPPIQVVPTEMTDDVRRDRVETFLNWQVRTELDLAPVVAESAHLFLQPGTVVAKTTWRVNRRLRRYVRQFAAGTSLQDLMLSLFGHRQPDDIQEIGAAKFRGYAKASAKGGPPLEVTFQFEFEDDGTIQVRVEQEDLTENPAVELIDPPNFIVPAKSGSDPDKMPWKMHRQFYTESQVRGMVLMGILDPEMVRQLLDSVPMPSGDRNLMDSTAYRSGKADTVGIEDLGPSDAMRDQYLILEDYRLYDIFHDGNPLEVITWYSPSLPGRVLGWDTLDNVYATGRSPFRVGRYFPVPFEFYGLSYAETIKGIQDEINAIHNQRVDAGTVQNMPFGVIRASSVFARTKQRLIPGEFVEVENPAQDVAFPRINGGTAFGMQEESLLMQYKERVDGLTDISMGRQPTRVGATRTAAGVNTLLQESGLRQKTALESFQRFWVGIFEDILALDQAYLPAGKEFRVTGKMPEFVRLKDRTEIQGRYDLRLAVATQSMNRIVAREDAQQVFQVLMNPLGIQSGLVGPKGIQRGFQDVLRAFGRDPEGYLEPSQAPHTAEEELQMIVSGQEVRAMPSPQLQAHLMAHQMQLAMPGVQAVLGPEGVQKLQKLMGDEQQALQLMMVAQQQAQKQPPAQQAQGKDVVEANAGANANQPNAMAGRGMNPEPGGTGGQAGQPGG